MRCAELANLLSKLEPGREADHAEIGTSERSWIDEIVRRGWAEIVPEDPLPERAALDDLKARLRALRANRSDGPVDAEERALRDQILSLSARLARLEGAVAVEGSAGVGPYRDAAVADASGLRLALTYAGRALLADVAPRSSRVGELPVDAFLEDMQMLRATLSSRARRAAQILSAISPQLRSIDEIHLRSAAVGLAARREATATVADAFVRLALLFTGSPLPDDREVVAAENAVVTAQTLDCIDARAMLELFAQAYEALRAGGAASDPDAANAALLLALQTSGAPAQILDQARTLMAALPPAFGAPREIAPAIHLILTGGVSHLDLPQRLAALEAAVRSLTGDDPASFAAAALLASADRPVDDALGRFGKIRGQLGRFSAADSSSSMTVPAALLTLVEADPAEVLDDLRIAGAAIADNGLSVGGVENVSLAVKLLLEVGLLATGQEGDPEERLDLAPRTVPALRAMGAVGLGAALPAALSAVAAFHFSTLHKMAISDFQVHPAHSNYGSSWGGGYYG